jgi:hypothetical protein
MKDLKDIKSLLSDYFEGKTSSKEERFLREYFQQKKIEENLEAEWAMFTYFAKEREKLSSTSSTNAGRKRRRALRVWLTSVAAACLLTIIGLRYFTEMQKANVETSLAYIDGKRFTDIRLIAQNTINGLNNLSDNDNSVIFIQIEAIDNMLERSEQ